VVPFPSALLDVGVVSAVLRAARAMLVNVADATMIRIDACLASTN
jgi:hypothetical protein